MAKGIKVIETTARTPISDNTYKVDGIEEFITKDEQGNTYFKVYGEDLKVGIKFRCVPDSTGERPEGPAMFLLPAEFVALVHLFGATDFLPTKENRTQAAVLLEGQKKANEKASVISVTSKNGYVNAYDIQALHPPKGQYQVIFKEAFSPKFRDSLEFSPGKTNEYIILKFQITGNTVWEGFVISVFLNNAFEDYVDENGTIYNAIEDERPIPVGKDGERWVNFGNYFADNLQERWDWQIEPSKSKYGVCEVTKPQYVMVNEAKKLQTPVTIWYEKREKAEGFWFDLLDLEKFNQLSKDRKASLSDVVSFVKTRTWEDFDVTAIFESEAPIVFSETGKAWAKKYLGEDEFGVWQQAGLSAENRSFDGLTSKQLGSLMDQLEARYTS